MKVALIIERGPSKGREIHLKRQTTVLGKSEQCNVRIASKVTSRRHCQISIEKDFVVLRDLNSRNGTYLNDTRLTGDAFLNNGDKIIVGDALFTLKIVEDERASTHTGILELANGVERPTDSMPAPEAAQPEPRAPQAGEAEPPPEAVVLEKAAPRAAAEEEATEPVEAFVPAEEEPVEAIAVEEKDRPVTETPALAEGKPSMVEEIITAESKPAPGALDTHFYEQVIEGLIAAGESLSIHYERTSHKVRNIMDLLTRVLGIGEGERRTMKLAAMLYEVGKYYLATDILNKGGALTPEETEKLKKHPQLAIRLFEKVSLPEGVKEAIAHHHERYDGAGYPDGLKGEEISAGARMLAMADALAAMTSSRPYRPALSTPQALDELEKNAGSQFDPAMVSKFVDYCRLHQNELREAVNIT